MVNTSQYNGNIVFKMLYVFCKNLIIHILLSKNVEIMTSNRRDFLRTASLGGLSLAAYPSFGSAPQPKGNYKQVGDTGPDPYQSEWMKLRFGMFIHFGINTYYDREWSEGDLDIAVFNPVQLDTDQWCSVAKKAGMKYIVIGAKHHDGFCLWPSKHTKYSVKYTPFGGDVIGQLSESAKKFGLKFGLYYSLWDCNQPLHDSDEAGYVDFLKSQLEELLSGYGDIVELWFDGFWKKQQSGWKDEKGEFSDPEGFINAWRLEGAYRWQMDHLYHYVKKLQPGCLVMNNATSKFKGVPLHPVDAVCGERATTYMEYRKVWPWLGKPRYFPMQIETTMSVKGNERFPGGNWFWHEWDHSVATKKQIRSWLETAGKMDANLLLNCGPMSSGKLRPEDVDALSNLQ